MDRRKLRALLQWYRQEVGDDFVAVLVINRDGIGFDVLTKDPRKSVQETLLGNVSLLIDLILKKITREFTLGSFGVGTFDTEEYRYIFCEAGPEYVLVTVLNALASVDPYFPYAYLAAEKVARIADGRPVSPVIPKIYVDEKERIITRKMNTLQQIKIHSSLYAYKLILGGEGGVGKTSMVHRFVDDVFQDDYKATIGTSITKKECEFDGLNSKVRFVIWDLAGQVQFKRVRQAYLADSEAGILAFDLTRRETFENIREWYKELTEHSPPGLYLILVGNKKDLEISREVTSQEAEDLARDLGLSYVETSAKTGENVNDAFKMLAMQMIKRFLETEDLEKIDTSIMEEESSKPFKIIPEFTRITEEEELKEEKGFIQEVKVRIKDVWPSLEEDFTRWLEKNIESLNKTLDMAITTVDLKGGTILGRDKYGSRVLVECQFGETREEILGKILTSIIRHNIKIVIWISEEPLQEHVKAINSLNKSMMNDAVYYLLKVEVFEKENVIKPNFKIICDPREAEDNTIRDNEINEENQVLSLENKRLKFWNQLLDKINEKSLDHSNLTASKSSWLFIPTGKEGLNYAYKIKENWASIELFLDNHNRLVNNERFKQLHKKKEEIFLFSHAIEWDYDEIRSFQSLRIRINGGLNDETNWDALQNKMIEIMKLLKNKVDPHLIHLRL
ncbi:MAG: DUF4268 domain-containing protein [Promethearchaeota archaeon]